MRPGFKQTISWRQQTRRKRFLTFGINVNHRACSLGDHSASRPGSHIKTSLCVFVLLVATSVAATEVAGQAASFRDPGLQNKPSGLVIDVALQAVNPGWFVRAMEGVDFGMHGQERYGELVDDIDQLLAQTLAEMDRSGIRYGLLVHGPHVEDWQARHPDRFLLSYVPDLSLTDHTAAAAEFEEGVQNGKYVALGELGLIYAGMTFDDPALFPYYEVAQKHGIPVLVHTGFSGPDPQRLISPAFRIGVADPILLENVLIRYPRMNVVMMHTGWPFFDEALYMLGTYPNVYMETSVAAWLLGPALFHRMVKEVVATAGHERLLFGSMQMAWPNVIGRSVSAIRDAEYLSPEAKEAILYDNAAKLIGLEVAALSQH